MDQQTQKHVERVPLRKVEPMDPERIFWKLPREMGPQQRGRVASHFKDMSDRLRLLLSLRFGLEDDVCRSQEETAKELGLQPEDERLLESIALHRVCYRPPRKQRLRELLDDVPDDEPPNDPAE